MPRTPANAPQRDSQRTSDHGAPLHPGTPATPTHGQPRGPPILGTFHLRSNDEIHHSDPIHSPAIFKLWGNRLPQANDLYLMVTSYPYHVGFIRTSYPYHIHIATFIILNNNKSINLLRWLGKGPT